MDFKNPNTGALNEKELYIFDMDGTTVTDDFTLPATIGGEAAEWKSLCNTLHKQSAQERKKSALFHQQRLTHH